MITITILSTRPIGGTRLSKFVITDDTDYYLWSDATVPSAGSIQTYLDDKSEELWTAAQFHGTSITSTLAATLSDIASDAESNLPGQNASTLTLPEIRYVLRLLLAKWDAIEDDEGIKSPEEWIDNV